MTYFDKRTFRENRDNIVFTITKECMLLLGYGDTVYFGISDGVLFIANETFTGAIERKAERSRIMVPKKLSIEAGIKADCEYNLYADVNDDIYFIPEGEAV